MVMSSSVAIGVARVVLHLPDSGSLKSKRQVISGLLRRLRQELKVTAAEVGELDRWQLAELAVATVSGDGRQADTVLAAALSSSELHAHQRAKDHYTTPLKALSNQKFHDFVRAYGESAVGLVTGENTIHDDAPVVVMTTEILRNLIYEDPARLDLVRYVVLDEVH